MADAQGNAEPGKGTAFFERADEVAEMGNWEFAIELYLEGIQREPDNLVRGHQKLREASLRRKLSGGKPAGMMEQLKRRPGKDPLANLINAEYLRHGDIEPEKLLIPEDITTQTTDALEEVEENTVRFVKTLDSARCPDVKDAERTPTAHFAPANRDPCRWSCCVDRR